MQYFAAVALAIFLAGSTCAAEPATDEVRRQAGYRGIWFTLGQFYGSGTDGQDYSAASRTPVFPYGDKYSGGLGTYTAKHSPLAVYAAQVDKTFFVYGGTTAADERHLLCMVSYYDHARHRVPRPVVVHDKASVNDPHDNPSLAIAEDGHLWVFVSGRARSRPGFKYRSLEPYSIDGFERISEEELTYPQPHTIAGQGFLHLFTKYTGVRELYWERSRDGREWTDDAKLAGILEPGDKHGGHYQSSASLGNKVGTFFNRHPQGNVDRRTDLYYVETSDMGQTWTTVTGQAVHTPIVQVDSPARVIDYAAQHLNVYVKDSGFDDQGRPVLLYLTSRGHEPGPPNDPREFRVTAWDGKQWQTTTVCAADHNYDMGSLYVEGPTWTVRVPSAAGPQPYQGGGEIENWQSHDRGATWSKLKQVTAHSSRNHNYARRPLFYRDPFAVFWADGDPTQLSPSHLYFADASGERVWKLPYDMPSEFAEPELQPSLVEADQSPASNERAAGPATCASAYPHHLQGVCTDGGALYWCFTTQLVKTDLDGKLLEQVAVANHHGDLCYSQGKLYVAVNLGKFNDPAGNADSWVYVYDAHTLQETARHEIQQVVYGAGGIGVRNGHFFVVGGLPANIDENYVYEYDAEFQFLKRHEVTSGPTLLGIQTATFAHDRWWFGCYGKPQVLLVTDADFQMQGKYEFDCSLGIDGLPNERLLVASGGFDKARGHSGQVRLALPDDAAGLKLVAPGDAD